MNDKPVLLFQRIVPSYRVAMFRYLYQELGIVICHSKPRKNGKINAAHEQMDYPNEMISRCYYQKDETAVVQNVLKPILKYKPKIVIIPFSLKNISSWLLFIFKPFFQYKIILWGHGLKNKEMGKPFKGLNGKVRLWFVNNADALLLYSSARQGALNFYSKTKSFIAKNTLDTRYYRAIYQTLEKTGRQSIKKALGMQNQYNIIYTGRLLKAKRIDLLMESFVRLSKKFDIGLHIIGDGEERHRLEKYQKDTPNIYLHGAVYDDQITAQYLYASDIMLMPGAVGLSIIHAFAFGVPMVTCRTTEEGPFHSPEIEYLEENKNGIFCQNDPDDIAENISQLLGDEEKLQQMKEHAWHTAHEKANVDNFIEGFQAATKYVVQS